MMTPRFAQPGHVFVLGRITAWEILPVAWRAQEAPLPPRTAVGWLVKAHTAPLSRTIQLFPERIRRKLRHVATKGKPLLSKAGQV
jgi:hypothetical protein